MSTLRTMPGGWVDRGAADGKCRWCGLQVPGGRYTFCSDWCVNEWRLRTNPGYVREQVLARDRGVCALCGTDTIAAWHELKRARGAHRLKLLTKWGLKGLNRQSLWDADHILPVAEGGGECDLDNMRTLCLICHRGVTAELRRRGSGAGYQPAAR
jgi:5-methylcytosine-specific restriction endonuclease McrA